MSQFLELNEAAKRLGVTPDKLVAMRSSGEIRGFRDGASWKFKDEDIDRAKAEMGDSLSGDDLLSFDDTGSSLDLADDESILVSEEELGHSGEATSSTIIGKATEASAEDSDLKLATASPESDLDLTPSGQGTDLTLTGGSGIAGGSGIDSDLSLVEPDEGGSGAGSKVTLVPGVGGSGVTLVPDPGSDKGMNLGVSGGGSGIDDILADDSELSLESPSSGGTGNLELSADTGGLGSGDLDMSLDSELALSDDDDMVLGGGSGIGSDLSLSAGDSGINLSSPTDSGLSLEVDSGIQLDSPTDSGLSLDEEPLDLGGSSISSLELPEDEDIVDLDDMDIEAPTAVKRDEEFLLSPSDEMFMDESDSGSQVIALEDSAAFDQDAATLVPGGLAGQALLAETDGFDQQLDSLGGGGAPAMPNAAASPAAAAAQAYAAEPPETPYSVWNILALLAIIILLCLCGVVMTDMLKNMWEWDEGGHDIATGISNGLVKAIGLTD